MNKVVNSKRKAICTTFFTLFFTSLLLAACSKNPPENQPEAVSVKPSAENAPTGLVKNPVKHDNVADVTKWMDKASTKTPAQIAQEEKASQEKAALEAQKLSDAKRQLNKPAPAASKETSQPAPLPPPVATTVTSSTPVVAKAPEPAPVNTVAPAVASVKPAEPERIVLKLVSSTQPKFPSAALRSGMTEGAVSAKLHIDPDGKVSQVEILKAKPSKYFDKEVIAAVSQWRYAPIARPYTTTLEFSFRLD